MPHFIRNGNTFRVTPNEALDIQNKLPIGNYTVKFNDMTGQFFLEMTESFKPVKKLYGDTNKNANRILNTYLSRTSSTGVMLNGEKGSGKTLLAKTISIEAGKKGIPTIIINDPWTGDIFNKFLQDIEQPTVILFDEFEKVYDNDHQEKALTLLDGVFPSRKLFVITCNDKWRVNEHMRNRPGRIFYMLDFGGLSPDFIIEYCNDNLKNKQHIDKLVEISSLFEKFNFDMLQATVEEMNRYDESPQDALKMLNAKPEFSNAGIFTMKLFIAGKEIQPSRTEYKLNPLINNLLIEWYTKVVGDDDDDNEYNCMTVTPNNIVKVDSQEGSFVYQKNDVQCILTRKKEEKYSYYDV
jgi:ATPase family associated with various cellular activities (AAA)